MHTRWYTFFFKFNSNRFFFLPMKPTATKQPADLQDFWERILWLETTKSKFMSRCISRKTNTAYQKKNHHLNSKTWWWDSCVSFEHHISNEIRNSIGQSPTIRRIKNYLVNVWNCIWFRWFAMTFNKIFMLQHHRKGLNYLKEGVKIFLISPTYCKHLNAVVPPSAAQPVIRFRR